MLSFGGTNRSLKLEVVSCSATGALLGVEGPSCSAAYSSLEPPRDERSLNRLDLPTELLGEAEVSRQSVC